MSGKQRAKAVVCVPEGPLRSAMEKAIQRAGFFESVGAAGNGDELAGLLNVHYPDLVILDEDLCPEGPEAFITAASAGRPISCLLLVELEELRGRRQGARGGRITRVEKAVVGATDLVSQNMVWARLLAMADQLTSTRHTQTAEALEGMVRDVRNRARHLEHRPQVVSLATWPLDLIVLVAGPGNEEAFLDVLPRIRVGRVPILIAVEGGLEPDVLAPARLETTRLDQSLDLRRATGFVVATAGGLVELSADTIHVDLSRPPGTCLDLLQSAASLGNRVLTIMIGHDDPNSSMGLATVLNAGGLVASLAPEESPQPNAPAAAIEWGVSQSTLTREELAWVLQHAVARRA